MDVTTITSNSVSVMPSLLSYGRAITIYDGVCASGVSLVRDQGVA